MKRKLTPEELHLWQAQLKGVKPLPKTLPALEKPSQDPVTRKRAVSPQPSAQPAVEKHPTLSSPVTIEGFNKRELRRLNIEGRFDLHGMTMDEAHRALEKFLRHAQTKKLRVVLIITGKGSLTSQNTLRHQVGRWFQETALRRFIVAFHHPAKPSDGGTGAYYVILRKAIKMKK